MQNTQGQIHRFESRDNFFRRDKGCVVAGSFKAYGRRAVTRSHRIGAGSVVAMAFVISSGLTFGFLLAGGFGLAVIVFAVLASGRDIGRLAPEGAQ